MTKPPRNTPRKEVTLAQLLPNMLTVVAICAGLTAIRSGLQGSYEVAVQLILLAAVLDGMDGRLARALKSESGMGAELDSLAAMHEPDPGLLAWGDAIARETGTLLDLPGVAEAQADLCAREIARLDALRAESTGIGRLLAAVSGEDTAQSQPAPQAETPPEADAPTPDPKADKPAGGALSLPPWFAEIHTGGDREGGCSSGGPLSASACSGGSFEFEEERVLSSHKERVSERKRSL